MSASRGSSTIDFWYEFGSTYSYPAAMRVEELANARGVFVVWRAFLLGPIFKAQGWDDSPFNVYPIKGRYMWRDLERICARRDLPFHRPSVFPRNGLLAARIACRCADAAWLPEFVRAVYRANFERDLEISDPAIIAHCLPESAGDPDALIAAASSAESKERLRDQTEEAVALGIFGAPTCAVDGELFWGDDRLEQAIAWAIERESATRPGG